ncbi:MAG: adenylosuccinate synthase [Acidimicrobiia bacterium]
MGVTVVLGAQWGDEGKGRVTDFFAEGADVVVRYQGGNNAGHTIIVGEERFALSLIPSGVMNPDAIPVIGNGCVVDPAVLVAELDMLTDRGIDPSRLRISPNAHLIMPWHKELDVAYETRRGPGAIGTTKKGIGPAYQDKVIRSSAIRVQDLLDPDGFRERVERVASEKNRILDAFDAETFDASGIADEYLALADRILPLVTDTALLVHRAVVAGHDVLFEGAQGTLLDVDHGTYPFVTSSSTTAGGAATGSGVGPKDIDEVVGVTKAYQTRVGEGPFPTELHDEAGERLVSVGGEFGVVTGRRRRPGWLDLVALRYACRVNSLTALFMTKLDVLSGFDEIPVAVGYRVDGADVDEFPVISRDLAVAEPRYETMPGWGEDLTSVRAFGDLPAAARDYVEFVEEAVGVPIRWVSVGPERQQVIER